MTRDVDGKIEISLQIHHRAVVNIEAKLEPGKIVLLIGRNGSGKTTLLKSIAGLNKKSTGSVFFKEQSHIPQMSFYFPIREISPGLILSDFINAELIQNLVTHNVFKIDPNDLFEQLSAGERDGVMVEFCLQKEASFYFLDEPFAHLDYLARKYFIEKFKRLKEIDKKTILFSSHDIASVRNVVDEVWFIEESGQLKIISPKELETLGL